MAKLTPKQQAFADYYIELGNASEAARKAGYSPKTAFRIGQENMQKPAIKEYIKERMEQLQSERVANQQEILEYLTSIMRGEQRQQTLRGMGEGYQEIDDIDVSAKDRIKAAELLGKRYAMWTEKQQVEIVEPVFVDDIPEED